MTEVYDLHRYNFLWLPNNLMTTTRCFTRPLC